MNKLIPILVCFFYSYFCLGQNLKKPVQLKDGIKTATLKEAGLDETILQAMVDSIVGGNYPNIHSVLILRNNKLVFERYFSGKDEVRGKGDVGVIDHHRDSLHDIRSVSKSIVSAAFMIAISQGKIKSTDQRVFDFFPEYGKYDTGMKRNITINHLLNMTAGLEWDEETYATNSERKMNNSPDAIEFVFSQKIVDTPGVKYNYSGGCTQILVAIIEKASGVQVDKFTEEYLFQPLGINNYTWVKVRDGSPSGASGLRMRSRDMLKFGMLYMNEGKWKGKQIIPAQMVSHTLESQVNTPFSEPDFYAGYSNQFWIYTENIENKKVTYAQCQGNGGQIIVLDKINGLIVVITAGNYNQSNLRKSSWDIYAGFVYPAIIKK